MSLLVEEVEKIKNFSEFYSDSFIDVLHRVYQDSIKEVEQEDYYQSYLKICNNTATLMRDLGIDDPMLASSVFSYLLWNGYFSKDRYFVFSQSNRVSNLGALGADIMRGRSVCINNARMLTRVLVDMGVDAHLMGCSVSNANLDSVYRPDIERKIDNHVKLRDKLLGAVFGRILKNFGNHAVTMFDSDGTYFVNDPTNLAFANFSGFLQGQYVESNVSFDYKPWIMLLVEDIDADRFRHIMEQSFVMSKYVSLTPDIVRLVYESSIDICQSNSFLLDDFYADNIKNIETVCKTLKRK